ncbi:MAG: hypothetical protein GXO79_11380 [Chlorobi bacterium]|nr:hypothetical protein [Chlorobiota bacterium]
MILKSPNIIIINSVKWIVIIALIVVSYQCVKEQASLKNPQVKLNPGLALPTVHAHYSLNSIFEPVNDIDILQPNDEGILSVRYNQKVLSDSASSFLKFNQEIAGSMNINLKNSSNKATISFYDTIEFNLNNNISVVTEALLYAIKFSTAQFEITDDSQQLPVTTEIDIVFPTIIDPFTSDTARLTHQIGEGATSILDMTDHVAYFINNTNITNGLPVAFRIGVAKNVNSYNLNYKFTLINFDYIKGYFGNFKEELNETNLNIDFLSAVDSIDIEFEKAEFNINYTNSFGITFDIYLDNLSATSIDNNPITIDFLPTADSPFPLRSPGIGQPPFDTTITYNINDVLALLKENPKQISFKPVGEFNPNEQNDTNYVSYDSQFALDIGLDIPLKFWASVIAYKEKFPFDGSSLDKITQLENLALLLETQNVLPLNAKIDVIFYKGQQVLYKVGNEEGFKISSDLDGEGIPIAGEPIEQILDIDNTQFENLKQADSLMLKIALTTARADEGGPGNRTYVAFKADADYYLDVTLKLIAEGEFVLPSE